jgi:HSP20 family molecular chaperone IbpA
MDVHEDEKNNLVIASFELPGLKKEDLNIELQGNQLTVSGETGQQKERKEDGWIVRER